MVPTPERKEKRGAHPEAYSLWTYAKSCRLREPSHVIIPIDHNGGGITTLRSEKGDDSRCWFTPIIKPFAGYSLYSGFDLAGKRKLAETLNIKDHLELLFVRHAPKKEGKRKRHPPRPKVHTRGKRTAVLRPKIDLKMKRGRGGRRFIWEHATTSSN